MKAKWTPGPWVSEYVGESSAGPDAVGVYEVTNGFRRIAEYISEADAILIAAAPEMAELLDDARAALESAEAETRNAVAIQIRALLSRINGGGE